MKADRELDVLFHDFSSPKWSTNIVATCRTSASECSRSAFATSASAIRASVCAASVFISAEPNTRRSRATPIAYLSPFSTTCDHAAMAVTRTRGLALFKRSSTASMALLLPLPATCFSAFPAIRRTFSSESSSMAPSVSIVDLSPACVRRTSATIPARLTCAFLSSRHLLAALTAPLSPFAECFPRNLTADSRTVGFVWSKSRHVLCDRDSGRSPGLARSRSGKVPCSRDGGRLMAAPRCGLCAGELGA
mmetsp:Transcript_4164/g.11795  ORF Transcript_4164/g.11795 Transcript_4164/m.11795 type:complete len:249 (+) Transcript_4164:96-842(+)